MMPMRVIPDFPDFPGKDAKKGGEPGLRKRSERGTTIRMGIARNRGFALAIGIMALACASIAARAAPAEDLVRDLPGLDGSLDVRMYSGYLKPTQADSVHYLFVESEWKESDPLVLWLNGGPGASSLMGAFTELGPYIVNGEKSLMPNPFGWNKVANVLFLESPTGVGFSYCEAMLNGEACKHNDTSTANLNFLSLKYFVEHKFPEFRGRDFMIWGESYAGVYVPTLADLVYSAGDALDLNFLGFGVGDPCTDDKTQTFTRHLNFNFEFAMGKGFVAQTNYKYITDNCIASDVNGIITPNETTASCKAAWRMYYLGTSGGGGNGPAATLPHGGFIDPYNSWGPNNNDFWNMLANYLADEEVVSSPVNCEKP